MCHHIYLTHLPKLTLYQFHLVLYSDSFKQKIVSDIDEDPLTSMEPFKVLYSDKIFLNSLQTEKNCFC